MGGWGAEFNSGLVLSVRDMGAVLLQCMIFSLQLKIMHCADPILLYVVTGKSVTEIAGAFMAAVMGRYVGWNI